MDEKLNETAFVSFGTALKAVKEGKLATRVGWNDVFIFQRPADILEIDMVVNHVKSLPQSVKDWFRTSQQSVVEFTPYLCMKSADNKVVNGWLASQEDMLANDWFILG